LQEQVRQLNFPSLDAYYSFVGQQITSTYLQQAAVSGLKPPAILTRQLEDIYAEQRTIAVADFTKESMPKPPAATEQELRDFYKANLADYAVPELRAFNVIQVSPMDFLGQVKVTDDQIKAAYDKRIKEFSTPETRELTTVKAPDRAKIQAVVDLSKQGKSLLDAVAATPGATIETKNVQPGFDKNSDFDKAAFNVAKGELMGPFQLDGGWAAAEVKTVTPGTPLPLNEPLKERLRDDIAFPDARKVYDQQVDASNDQLASGVSFDDLARDLNAPILSLPPVDVRGRNEDAKPSSLLAPYLEKKPGEGQQTLLPAAFAMQSGGLPFSVDADYCPPPAQPDRATCRSRLIVQLAGITPPHTRSFEDVRAKVEAAWTRGKLTDAIKKASDDVLAKVKAGATLETVAKAAKLNYQVVPAVIDRMNQQMDPNVVEPILKLNKGEIAALQLGNKLGDIPMPTLVYVTEARKVDPAAHPEIAQVAQRSVARDLEGDILQVLLRGAALKAKPTVNDAAVQAYAQTIAGTAPEAPQ
jgi:peptidyl-prolyl cis-trans isomerase D